MEQIKANSINIGIVFSTTLQKEVYEELTELAKSLSTGRGHWDYGVAIQFLLESRRVLESQSFIVDKILSLEQQLNEFKKEPVDEKKEEKKEETINLLGGIKLNKN